MMSLENMLIAAEGQAREVILENQGELPPTWILVNAKSEIQVEMTPWEDELEKKLAELFIRLKMKCQGTIAYSVLTEAWCARAPEGWDPAKDQPIAASQCAERGECVIAVASDGKQKLWRFWDIKRDSKGKAVKLELRAVEYNLMQSWLSEFLTNDP